MIFRSDNYQIRGQKGKNGQPQNFKDKEQNGGFRGQSCPKEDILQIGVLITSMLPN